MVLRNIKYISLFSVLFFTSLIANTQNYSKNIQSVVNRKCGTMEYLAQKKAADPTLESKIYYYEKEIQNWISKNKNNIKNSKTVITIPVVVHIVYNTASENVSDLRVQEQIDVLNRDYAGLNPHSMGLFPDSLKVNTGIQFCLAKKNPNDELTNGIERRQTTVTSFEHNISDSVKFFSKGGLDAWDPGKYLNIWVCNLRGTLAGYAQFPTEGVNSTFGVVIDCIYLGVTGTLPPFNCGGVTTHELGHCFDLYHIWGDDYYECSGTDYCDDTPNQAGPTEGSYTGILTDSCSSFSPGIMYMNFMDYTDDVSWANFTPDQKNRIQACFAPGGLLYSLTTSDACTPPDTCGIPTNVTVYNITNNSASFSWIPPQGSITSYYKLIQNYPYPVEILSGFENNNSIQFINLQEAVSYEFQIQTICTAGFGNPVSVNFVTLGSSGCGIPDGLTATSVTSNSATIEWTANPNALSYNIRFKKSDENTWTKVTSATNSIGFIYLLPNKTYEIEVQAICSSGTSNFSTTYSFTALPLITCGTPTGIYYANNTYSSISLEWDAVYDAVSYNVKYRKSGTATWNFASSYSNSITIGNLLSNTTYECQLQSVCTLGSGSYTALYTFTTLSLPDCGIPTGLTAYNISNNSATIEWTSVTDALSYNIRYRKTGALLWTSTTSNITSKLLNGLTTNATYEYQVQAICSTGQSGYSTSFSFVVAGNSSCGIPEGLKVTPFAATAIIEWTAVSGATEYNVQYRKLGEVIWTNVTTYVNSIELSGLTFSATYEYQVRAVCPAEPSAYSYLYTFTTLSGISCADNYEPNNQIYDATTIPVNTNINGTIENIFDIDFFKFSNTAIQKNIKITLSNLPSDYDFELINSSGNSLLISQNSGTTDETIIYNNGVVGDYYIKISGFNNVYFSTDCYVLNVNISCSNYKITGDVYQNEYVKTGFAIYPNPATDKLNLSYNAENDGFINIKLIDVMGRIVSFNEFTAQNGLNNYTIDLNSISKGLYFVELINGKSVITSKLFID